jgi:hypothetical protein
MERWVLYHKDLDVQVMDLRVKLAGAFALLLGGWVGYRNLTVARENLRSTQETLRVTQDRLEVDRTSQVTNRYTQAITQLGAELHDGGPNLEVRLGGIYALERLAKDSPSDHWTIVEVLAAYIRENSKKSAHVFVKAPRVDVQAALTVIARRTVPKDFPEPGPIDFRRVRIRGALLGRGLLEKVNFGEAVLREVNLVGADLSNSFLQKADLRGAIFFNTRLDGAQLMAADLRRAVFLRPDEIGSVLAKAEDFGRNAFLTVNHRLELEEYLKTLGPKGSDPEWQGLARRQQRRAHRSTRASMRAARYRRHRP